MMPANDPAATLRAALSYADRGWPAFILSASKAPLANCDRCRIEHTTAAAMEACECLTCHGFYSASTDPGRIAEMIRLHPRGLLAIRTGAVSGTTVVDVDPPGIETMRVLVSDGHLPRTVAAITGRDGFHLIYGHPGGKIMSGAGKGGAGIDIKSDGGYIVVAPSVHPTTGKAYRWLASFTDPLTPLPRYWTDRLRPPAPRASSAPGAWSPPPVRPGSYAAAALREEAEAVATAQAGRNCRLNRAAFSCGQLVAAGTLTEAEVHEALMAAAEACGLVAWTGARACEATIASGLRAGMANPRRPAA